MSSVLRAADVRAGGVQNGSTAGAPKNTSTKGQAISSKPHASSSGEGYSNDQVGEPDVKICALGTLMASQADKEDRWKCVSDSS